jgi:formylglycine-generating enzyme required for sulfatase activity
MVLNQEPTLSKNLGSPFREIVTGCLVKEPKDRWTAQQVLTTLKPPVIQFATPLASPSPQVLTLDLPGNIKLEMIKIPAGSFLMGSTKAEVKRLNQEYSMDCYNRELPQHRVTLQEYYLGKYPVTQEQYQAVMGNNPSYFKDNPKNPVEQVSWKDTKAFCQKVYDITEQKVRLPTEAEWEYGCRAGTTTPFYFGETISTEQANYDGNYTFGEGKKGIYQQKTTLVRSFPPNKFGLYDMHGNVREWCEDSWHDSYAEKPESIKQNGNTIWSSSNKSLHVLRGGSWVEVPSYCRSADRLWFDAGSWSSNDGFRLALSIS